MESSVVERSRDAARFKGRMDADVIIVGAGPVGLMLANFLGQAGVRTLVIERNTSTVSEPRAVSIDDEALRAMQWLGLEDELIATLSLDYGSHYFDAQGKRFAMIEPTEIEHGYPKRNAFKQIEFERILLGGARRFSCVDVRFATEVTHLEHTAGQGKIVAQAVTSNAPPEQLTARWIVGCDGGRSTVRRLLNIPLQGNTYDKKWLIVDLLDTQDTFRQSRVICDPARPCITLPGPGGIRRYEFMLHDGESDEAMVDEKTVRGLLGEVGPDAHATIGRVRAYTFHARVAERWRDGRTLLAGDAAHLSPPFAGQGLNSGIRDAVNLGWKLAAVVRGCLNDAALDTYEAERKPHVWAMIYLSLRMGEILMSENRLRAALTPWFFRMLGCFPAARDYLQQMRYRPRPRFETGLLVPGRSRMQTAIGWQFPQPLVELPDRAITLLDRILPAGFCVVTLAEHPAGAFEGFSPSPALTAVGLSLLAVVPRQYSAIAIPGVIVCRDACGVIAKRYPWLGDCYLLLRPDRYVAAIALRHDPNAWRRIDAALEPYISAPGITGPLP
jgi:3-(3-hydroxy-phenyl)propionate hydroxylase